jgi:hypothetical protein
MLDINTESIKRPFNLSNNMDTLVSWRLQIPGKCNTEDIINLFIKLTT